MGEQVDQHCNVLTCSCESGWSGLAICSTNHRCSHLHRSAGHQQRASLHIQIKDTIVVLFTGAGTGVESLYSTSSPPTTPSLPWSAFRQSSSPWNSSVPELATAPTYVAVSVVATKTSSVVNAPASVAMPVVVQVSIHHHYHLHLVQKSIHRHYFLLLGQILVDYHYQLRLVLAAIHLSQLLLVQVSIVNTQCW